MPLNVKIRRVYSDDTRKKRATCSVTIDDMLTVHDVALLQQPDGKLFLGFPGRMDHSGVFRDIVHPVNAGARWRLEEAVIKAYESYMAH